MSGVWWAVSLLGLAAGIGGLTLGVRLAGRYRELRTALLAAGVLVAERTSAAEARDDSGLPALGSPVPPRLRMTTTTGAVLDREYFAGPELVLLFLMDRCAACDARLSELYGALSGLPPDGARPVVVLSGPPEDNRRYRKVFEPVAHVVEDGPVKSGTGVVMAFQMHAFPALLVVADGTVRRAGSDAAVLSAA